MRLCDYHTHTRMSPDGVNTAYEMALAAAERGFSEIVLTDHYDVAESPIEEYRDFVFDYHKMRADFEEARDRLADRIEVKLGIELGQANHIPEMADGLLAQGALDFVLLSHHNCFRDEDYYFMDFRKRDPYVVFEQYLDSLYETAGWHDYDVLAHLTYPLRYIAQSCPDFDLTRFSERIDRVLRRVIETGHGLEVNTATLRKGLPFTMPDFDIVRRYLALGGETITLGSDAHFTRDVGADIAEVRKALCELGAKYLATFRARKASYIPMY